MVARATVAGVRRSPDEPPHDPRSVLTRAAVGPDVVLRWADHADGLADVWLPPRIGSSAPLAPAPLLYAVHGGFWQQSYDRHQLAPLAAAVRDLGWAVVVPEYARVGGRHREQGLQSPWPLIMEDLRAVRRRVPELLAEVAPGRVADDSPVVLGHSAGGHLALWWGLDAGLDAGLDSGLDSGLPSRVRRVVALAPVADLGRAASENLDDGAAYTLLDADPRAVPGHADGADVAARLRAGEAAAGCELVVIHGDQDAHVPLAHSVDLAADVPAVRLTVLPGVEHFGLIDPISDAWPAALAALPQVAHGIRLRK